MEGILATARFSYQFRSTESTSPYQLHPGSTSTWFDENTCFPITNPIGPLHIPAGLYSPYIPCYSVTYLYYHYSLHNVSLNTSPATPPEVVDACSGRRSLNFRFPSERYTPCHASLPDCFAGLPPEGATNGGGCDRAAFRGLQGRRERHLHPALSQSWSIEERQPKIMASWPTAST